MLSGKLNPCLLIRKQWTYALKQLYEEKLSHRKIMFFFLSVGIANEKNTLLKVI
jgi:hypothetical protein